MLREARFLNRLLISEQMIKWFLPKPESIKTLGGSLKNGLYVCCSLCARITQSGSKFESKTCPDFIWNRWKKQGETRHRCCMNYATQKSSKNKSKFNPKKHRRPSGNAPRAHLICSCISGTRDTDASTTCTARVRNHLASLWAGKRQLRLAKPASVIVLPLANLTSVSTRQRNGNFDTTRDP